VEKPKFNRINRKNTTNLNDLLQIENRKCIIMENVYGIVLREFWSYIRWLANINYLETRHFKSFSIHEDYEQDIPLVDGIEGNLRLDNIFDVKVLPIYKFRTNRQV